MIFFQKMMDHLQHLKKCCPSANTNQYHIRIWHEDDENLLFEEDGIQCKVCRGSHDTLHCPCVHPLNRQESEPKYLGPFCAHCHGKHLGIYCKDRPRN